MRPSSLNERRAFSCRRPRIFSSWLSMAYRLAAGRRGRASGVRGHVQHGPIEQLNDLIDGGAMTPGAVEGITGIDWGRVEALLGQPPSHRGIETSSSLSVDETARISQLAAALACGAEIEAAARIRAVSELLTIALELSPAMLARCCGSIPTASSSRSVIRRCCLPRRSSRRHCGDSGSSAC
ncbi:HTH domain-containing protein [Microbacterium gorillae]|uniref:HTH domain-containing protein n=1 Tax=Microbacterium gorillae TaxID=1231063 RepID=UPI003D99732F